MKKSKLLFSLAALLLAFFMTPQTAHAAGFVQDAAGVKYQNDDGTFLKDNWVQVGQSIYHLDANGYVQFGWIQVGNLWYDMGTDGICQNPTGASAPSTDNVTSAATTADAQPAANTAASVDPNNIFAKAGWVPFQTSNTALMQHGIATGYIGFDGTSYWAEPTFAATALTAASTNVSAAAASVTSVTAAQQEVSTLTYVINTNTKKFHLPSCSSVGTIKARNRKDSGSTLEAIKAQGYVPCKRCLKGR